MSNEEILIALSSQIEALQQEFDMKESIKLDSHVWNWFFEEIINVICESATKSVNMVSLMQYLNIRSSLYLNLMETIPLRGTLALFDRIIHGQIDKHPLVIRHFIIESSFDIRQGRINIAENILKRIIQYDISPLDKIDACFLLSEINMRKCNNMFPDRGLQYLCEALGEAERIGYKEKILCVYENLGFALMKDYPALSYSMLYKAQVLAEKMKSKYHEYSCKIYRARSSISMIFKCNKNNKAPSLFREDAENIINGIDRNDIPCEYMKVFYDETRGFVLDDVESLEKAYDYFVTHNAYAETFELSAQLFYKEYCLQRYSKAEEIISISLGIANNLGDKLWIKS